MDNNELKHYGVLGMRWGVRRRRPSSVDRSNLKRIRKKRIGEMSNQELNDANKRLQLERQYKDLTSRANRGRKIAKNYIATAALITGSVAATTTFRKAFHGVANVVMKGVELSKS